ncbi:hypothetical protein MASSI9I_90539 [Massilia sp. 9I]|nr:hypothetical protein MASSI9I_90539 [Massilia sp. 9I]
MADPRLNPVGSPYEVNGSTGITINPH